MSAVWITVQHPSIKRLVHKYGGKLLTFAELPDVAQKAITMLESNTVSPSMNAPNFEQTAAAHPEARFGLAFLPMKELTKAVMRSADVRQDFRTFAEYHEWYRRNGIPKHGASVWPVIANWDSDPTSEPFIDGWHRFHSYYDAGLQIVPVLWYAS